MPAKVAHVLATNVDLRLAAAAAVAAAGALTALWAVPTALRALGLQ